MGFGVVQVFGDTAMSVLASVAALSLIVLASVLGALMLRNFDNWLRGEQ